MLTVAAIIPAFNSAGTIRFAIDSVLAQTVPCEQVIVVDDGSSDETAAFVESYGNSIQLLRQSNRGAAAARNHGARAAQTDLMAFLDADDIWHSRKVELQSAAMAAETSAVGSYTRFQKLTRYEEYEKTSAVTAIHTVQRNASETFLMPYWGTPTVMVRRTAFQRCGGFDESLHTAEDVDLWLRLGASGAGDVICMHDALTGVRQLSTGLSARSGLQGDYNNLLVVQRFAESHPAFAPDAPKLVRKMQSEILTRIGATLLCGEDWREAGGVLSRALRTDPRAIRPVYLWLKYLARSLTTR